VTALIIGAVLVAVAAVVLVASSVGGGSSGNGTTGAASSTAARGAGAQAGRSPANLSVVVLNGTTTNGLAHLVSGELHQHGYSRAAPLGGRPAGADQVTVVEYAGGHRTDAEAVARSVHVTQVRPIEGAVAALAGSASVVVIVGADRAPSTGTSGEASGAGGGPSSPGSGEPSGANGAEPSGGAGEAAP
jgi:hypothetical protein